MRWWVRGLAEKRLTVARLHPVVGDILAVRVQVELALQTVMTPFHVLKHNQYFRSHFREALIYYETS